MNNVFSLISTLIPIILKIVLYILERTGKHRDAKEKLLLYIKDVEKDLPIKLHEKHKGQIERLKQRLKEESNSTKV